MIELAHPDTHLESLLSSKIRPIKKTRLQSVHDVCRARFDRGERSFQPAEVARELAAEGVMAPSSYMGSSYLSLGEAWQNYADSFSFPLDISSSMDHPDTIFKQLLADPKRRGNGASTLRALHHLCRQRFNRGEMNFSATAVQADAKNIDDFTGGIDPKRYKELLRAWQTVADERGAIPIEGTADNEPDAVFQQRLREDNVKSSTIIHLKQVQDLCQARFDQGEYDFGASAMSRALIEGGIFKGGLSGRLRSTERWRSILEAWQTKADARWIDGDPNLASTNPHAVFRRLRGKVRNAGKHEILLGIHRACYLEFTAGHTDFSVQSMSRLLKAKGILPGRSLAASAYEDLRILINAWDEYARPWLTADGGAPPAVRLKLRKTHDSTLEWVQGKYPELNDWRKLAVEWLHLATSALGQRIAAVNAFFDCYLTREDVPNIPTEFLRRGLSLPDISVVVKGLATTNSRVTRINYLHDFLQWVLLRDCSVEADDGELVVSPAFRNPITRAVAPRGAGTPSQSVRSPLPYGYIHTLRRILAPGLTFRDWDFAHNAQGAEEGGIGRPPSYWFEVDRSLIDEDDPDCVWRLRTFSTGRVAYQMWSPVRWVALLIKLLLPLRTGQVRMLDSGESDTWRCQEGEWVLNNHPLAIKTERKLWQQGVLRRYLDPSDREANSTVLYINTNKTADMDKDGPSKGYTMPWFAASDPLDNVYYWLEKLRNWQEKYNPVKRQTEWSELGGKHINAKTSTQLASYAPTCFLFRLPEEPPTVRHLPLTDGVLAFAWASLLEHLQMQLAANGETHPGGQPILFIGRNENGNIDFNDFPLHSLRVSLITAFALDGGVPFAILQKLVGHARLLMTLYYTKPGQKRMTAMLREAADKIGSKKEESIHGFLLDTEHDLLVKRAICNSPSTLSSAIPIRPSDRNPAGWMLMHHGACLVGGNVSEIEGNKRIGGCYNGGPSIGSLSHPVNAPVPGGSRNCVRCRWFVTEPHYLGALAAHFNTVAYHFDESRNRAIDSEKRYQELLRQKAEQEFAGTVFEQQKKLLTEERLMEAMMREFSDRAEDLVATWRLIERCKNVLNSDPVDGLQLVIQGGVSDIEAVFEETTSELLQLCGVCDAIELYPDLEADKAVLRRSQLLDSALYNEGLPPMFLTLSQDEQLRVGNAFMRSLCRNVAPNDSFIGQRKVVEVIDAGEKLGESLGINLSQMVSEVKLGSNIPHRMTF